MKTILYTLLLILCSCTTSKKFTNSEQTKQDTQEATEVEQQTQTKSIAFDGSKINLVYNHATPNANIFTYNVQTGAISTNGIVGVNVETKKIIEKQTVNFLRYVHQNKVVTITKTVTKTKEVKKAGIAWWIICVASIAFNLLMLYRWVRKTFHLPTPVI